MHEHNHWYGGGQVLAVHALGKRRWSVPSIPGHVQHEWDVVGVCDGDRQLNPSLTAYLWSVEARQRRQQAGLRNHVTIGAPWLYLLGLDPAMLAPALTAAEELAIATGAAEQPAAPKIPSGDLVVFASHGLDGEFAARRLVAQINERQQGAVTIALTHRDFAVPPIRNVYESAGLTVHDLGPLADASGTPEPRYLHRVLLLLRSHGAVGGNAPRSELLYAASLELPIHLFGESSPWTRPLTDPAEATAFADEELGREFLLSPAELNDVLEWSERV